LNVGGSPFRQLLQFGVGCPALIGIVQPLCSDGPLDQVIHWNLRQVVGHVLSMQNAATQSESG
jgi:hypothetical protein